MRMRAVENCSNTAAAGVSETHMVLIRIGKRRGTLMPRMQLTTCVEKMVGMLKTGLQCSPGKQKMDV
jgi:hypothetical protein